MVTVVEGYGRYGDPPPHVRCPRAASDMTPCIARDGQLALADDGRCVGCDGDPCELLDELRHAVTGKRRASVVVPKHAADKLTALVRQVTA